MRAKKPSKRQSKGADPADAGTVAHAVRDLYREQLPENDARRLTKSFAAVVPEGVWTCTDDEKIRLFVTKAREAIDNLTD